ncbi:MAG: hypothetical protein O6913_00370, partial [Chloroflexi bacterium]|nr:hypothetical protein [Chloroflexota bacterium]
GSATITLTVEDGDGLTASGSFLLTVTADTTPAGGDTFPMILVQGFNLITFTGPDGATPRQFAELIGTGRVGGIFRFNGVSQSFDSFFLSAPTFVNSLFNLTSRDPIFVLITPGPQIVLELPALTNPNPNRVVSLFNGWTLVGYTGLVTAIDELFFRVTTSVAGIFSFDAFTQLYRANFPNPNTPSFVDQFTIVGPLDVLYILSERPVPAALTFPETGLPIAVAGR